MRFLSGIILALVLSVLPSCKFLNNKVFGKKARAIAELQARQDSLRIVDSIRLANERLVALENARLDSLRMVEEAKAAAGPRYNIIVGSFITPEYARQLSDEYSKMGYSVRLIKPEKSKFEFVAAEGHDNIRTAVKRLAQFRDTVQLESWIYVDR
ncbi:MAG TPA: hypothetical protein VHO50_12630 [Bacteroidales bacterium]|nr:hypothetical protein [Bacteroidales bacterium]